MPFLVPPILCLIMVSKYALCNTVTWLVHPANIVQYLSYIYIYIYIYRMCNFLSTKESSILIQNESLYNYDQSFSTVRGTIMQFYHHRKSSDSASYSSFSEYYIENNTIAHLYRITKAWRRCVSMIRIERDHSATRIFSDYAYVSHLVKFWHAYRNHKSALVHLAEFE